MTDRDHEIKRIEDGSQFSEANIIYIYILKIYSIVKRVYAYQIHE